MSNLFMNAEEELSALRVKAIESCREKCDDFYYENGGGCENCFMDFVLGEFPKLLLADMADGGERAKKADKSKIHLVTANERSDSMICDPQQKIIGKWKVRIIRSGDRYGRDNCTTHDEDGPLVEFECRFLRDNGIEEWSFTGGRYYLETLLEREVGSLNVAYSQSDQIISAEDMKHFLNWMKQYRAGATA